MKIAIAKETDPRERRVALIPDTVARLVKQGFEVWLEQGAGEGAFFPDDAYVQAGAKVVADTAILWGEAEIVLKVGIPQSEELKQLRSGGAFISFLSPLANPQLIQQLATQGVTAFSMELIPRTSRAQSMDALSSQAGVAGYKAVLLAAAALPKFFPMLTTAAGTIKPAKVFVLGAGVAGLQAIATSRRLGAVIEAFDIRPAVKEEVQSLGAKFIEIILEEETVAAGGYAKEISERAKEKTQEVLTQHVRDADVVITTAQVPGKKAPILVTEAMIAQMKPGSVVVDLAADQGGNCEGIQSGKSIQFHGVTMIGTVNLPADMPIHASQMYSKNIATFLQYLVKDGQMNLNFADDIISSTCVAHNGEVLNQRIKDALLVSSP